jgi:hypothetical protein
VLVWVSRQSKGVAAQNQLAEQREAIKNLWQRTNCFGRAGRAPTVSAGRARNSITEEAGKAKSVSREPAGAEQGRVAHNQLANQ